MLCKTVASVSNSTTFKLAASAFDKVNSSFIGKNIVESSVETLISTASALVKDEKLSFDKLATNFISNLVTNSIFNSIDITKNTRVKEDVVEGGSGSVPRPTWRQSELDAVNDFPNYSTQKSFIDGKEVPYGTKGSVRPDFYTNGSSIDIKNYNVTTSSGRSKLASNIEKQYLQRLDNLPAGTNQSVMIDIRGQNVSDEALESLYNNIMKRTNNGVDITFKTK